MNTSADFSKFKISPFFVFKCWILLKTVLGGVDGNLHLPVPSMNRLNQTESAVFLYFISEQNGLLHSLPCSIDHSKWTWRCRRVRQIRMQGLLDRKLRSCRLLRTVCVETRTHAALARSSCENLARRAKTNKNRSWAGVVTLCWPPACLLAAGVPCSRYLSQAQVMSVLWTPSAAPTWRKMAPCCTIPTALSKNLETK
jgi:hypothetical protein